ncbi:MAG TPA: alpha/beta hydrolase [Aggregatilineales bacterium]|nr:alpha/beta hydrolase [Aggregatilineales bacterium]
MAIRDYRTSLKQFLPVEGGRIAYTLAGDPSAPPLIFIHGWLSHGGIWRTLAEMLQQKYSCVMVDLLGLGDSDKPSDGDYSIAAQGRRVLALADALGIQRFTLIGHSMGGQIALCIAGQLAPERVVALVDVSGVATGKLMPTVRNIFLPRMRMALGQPWVWKLTRWYNQWPVMARLEFSNWFYNSHQIPFADWAIDRHYALQPDMHTSAYRTGQAIMVTDLSAYLSSITVPTLVLFGAQDAVVPVREGEVVAECVPGARLKLLDNCGHFPMLEKAEPTRAVIKAFLEEHLQQG